MVFKELEIQGFKSFPDKVRIRFDEGITGVVGPNGSGKSNLSDAVRWVLGETSSRQLRAAGKMEDVIFGGTRRRGAMGFAVVRLTLDNSAHTLDIDATKRHRPQILPLRRERVHHQRPALPPQGHLRAAAGHRHRPGRLLCHRTGPHRGDRRRKKQRAPRNFRGSLRHRQVPLPQKRGGAASGRSGREPRASAGHPRRAGSPGRPAGKREREGPALPRAQRPAEDAGSHPLDRRCPPRPGGRPPSGAGL